MVLMKNSLCSSCSNWSVMVSPVRQVSGGQWLVKELYGGCHALFFRKSQFRRRTMRMVHCEMLVEEHEIEYWPILWRQQGICLDRMPLVWSRRCCGCEAIEAVAARPSLGEVGLQVACVGMCGICKDVGIPLVAISPGKISPCVLLEDMFQNEQVGNTLTILVAQVFKVRQEGKSPFIQILVLPRGAREWFDSPTYVSAAPGCLWRMDSTSYWFKEPPVILVLQLFKAESVIQHWREHFMHVRYFAACTVGLSLQHAFVHGCGMV